MSRPFGPLAKTRLVQLYVLQGGRLIVEAANSGARGALGYRRRELEGLPFADLCPAAAHGMVRDALKTLRKTGDGVRQFELQLRHRDGTLQPTRARIRRLKGEPRRLLVECLDLTAQQRDQAGLVRASTLLQTVERETATGGWRLSPAGDRLELTETAANLFSVPRRSVPLEQFLHVFDTSTRRKLSEALQVCGTGGTAFGLAAVTRDASDRIGWVSGRHVRHAGGGHEVVGTLASHPPLPTAAQRHPVTGSGITQAAEVRGAARIAAHVEGEGTKRFDLLSQLARGAADATSDPAVRRLLRELELHARRGDDLGRQLALLGRTYPVTPRSVRLNDLLDPLAAALEIEMAPKALEWHLARDLPEVAIDPAAWRLALRSLLRLVGRDLDDEAARLHVTTGQGRFDAEALTQAHAGATGAPGRYQFVQVAGAGRRRTPPQQADAAAFDIGVLSGFTQLHDGILLLSRPEQQTPGAALLLPAPRIPVATAAHRAGTPPRVLVAEPEAEDLEQLREIAAGIGIEIVPALDTHEAVRALQDNPQGYAAVMLSHATGAPHLAQDAWLIRQANAGIVLLIASGFNERYAARQFATIGATAFVQKPYVDGELTALLQKHRVLPGAPA